MQRGTMGTTTPFTCSNHAYCTHGSRGQCGSEVDGEIMDLENYMANYKKMLRCVFEVLRETLDENKKILVDITCLNFHVEYIEGNS